MFFTSSKLLPAVFTALGSAQQEQFLFVLLRLVCFPPLSAYYFSFGTVNSVQIGNFCAVLRKLSLVCNSVLIGLHVYQPSLYAREHSD